MTTGAGMISLAFTSFVGALFLDSAWAKFRNVSLFQSILQQYAVPGGVMTPTLARAIPVVEALVGACLLGWPWLPATLALASAAVFVFATSGALLLRAARGEREFACGCGSDLNETSRVWWLIARNLALLAAIVWVAGQSVEPATSALASPYLTGLGILIGGKLGHAAVRAWRRAQQWLVPG